MAGKRLMLGRSFSVIILSAFQHSFGIFTPRIGGNDPIRRAYFSNNSEVAATTALFFDN